MAIFTQERFDMKCMYSGCDKWGQYEVAQSGTLKYGHYCKTHAVKRGKEIAKSCGQEFVG